MIKEVTKTNLGTIWYHLEPSEGISFRGPLFHKTGKQGTFLYARYSGAAVIHIGKYILAK